MRSTMLVNPWPSDAIAGSKPVPSSATENVSRPPPAVDVDRDVHAAASVLGRVVHRLGAAEVDGRLGLAVEAIRRDPPDAHVDRGMRGHPGERVGQATGEQQRREDAVGQRAQRGRRLVQLAPDLLEDAADGVGVGRQQRLGQLHLDRDGSQLGLRPVVQISFETPPLGVGHGHQAGARGAQFDVAAAQVVDRAAQLAIQLGVVQHGSDEAGDPRERLVVAVVEVV